MNCYRCMITAKEDSTRMFDVPMVYTISCIIYAKAREEASKMLFSEIKDELGALTNIITNECVEVAWNIPVNISNAMLFFKIDSIEVNNDTQAATSS